MKLTHATCTLLALLVALPVAGSAQSAVQERGQPQQERGQKPPEKKRETPPAPAPAPEPAPGSRGQTPPGKRGDTPKPADGTPQDEAPARGRVHDGAANGQNLRARYGAAIDDLQTKALARGATREDYQRVVDSLTAGLKADQAVAPGLANLNRRAAARIQGIEERARTGAVDATDFDALRDSLVDMDLQLALGRLNAAAKEGKYTRAEHQAFLQAWNARAAAAKDGNPELDAITNRAKAAVDAIQRRAEAGAVPEADLAPLNDAVAEARTNIAVRSLETRAMNKKATEADYDDVTEAVRASSGDEVAKKVEARLNELKSAVEGGRITREQFAELRTMLVKRAQAASSGK